ncbi:hypothetical protein QKU48_gp1069 [Fadolivirus algeromassiliense]|jgi:hypothetical protein|uniref:Uncharacterized protein n=1 Tax=Fadolivirus FV1/VV64 TaxID=3070911 RepID=A0A7D3QUW6_9VIRU|nr:hypothetical protein QKU48_gp1069 [Fadolivirus algeromassiliense]QKF94527.1 hypothetical protein Fadolivirus_1_1069 [Fadolivirus FV1/VV64]
METLISYAYYETNKTIFNLEYFSEMGIINDKKYLYIIVINGEKCSVKLPDYDNVIVLRRPNVGYDFGGHKHALEWVTNKYGTILPFKYYIFLNCSVIGPFLPTYFPQNIHWSTIFTSRITNKIKLVGTTISCLHEKHKEYAGPKIGGYFFVTDTIGLQLMINRKDIFMDHETKINAIAAEYKVTNSIFDGGYGIDCLLYKYQGIDWKDKNYIKFYEDIHPDRQGEYFGLSIHPFEVVFHKWTWSDQPNKLVNFEYCAKYSEWSLKKHKINLVSNPFYALTLFERENITILPDYNEKYNSFRGLCNQIFSLVNGIIKCAASNKKYIVLDAFNCCVENHNICEVGKIINFDETIKKLNTFENYENIKLFDRSNIKLSILDAQYGSGVDKLDITHKLIEYANQNIGKNLSKVTNAFCGNDPCKFVRKTLKVTYSINEQIINENIMENDEIFLNNNYIQNELYVDNKIDFGWYDSVNETDFVKILNTITFTKEFYEIVDSIKKKHKLEKINVVHFRIESDAIEYWSKQNKMSKEEFETKIYNKYTNILNKYTNPKEIVYILSYNEENVINKIGGKHKFLYTSKETKNSMLKDKFGINGREMCAIIDLLLGITCCNLFIGCHSYKYKRGSSFSYILAKMVKCKKILIDLDNINNEEEIYE